MEFGKQFAGYAGYQILLAPSLGNRSPDRQSPTKYLNLSKCLLDIRDQVFVVLHTDG